MILLDSSLLLNEFFHRNPGYGSRRTGREPSEELLDFWQKSHEALLRLSLQSARKVLLADYVLLRLACVLSDLGVPAAQVQEELAYWHSSFALLPVTPAQVEEALAEALERGIPDGVPAEDAWMAVLAGAAGIDYILSPWTRQNTLPGKPRIITPDQLEQVLG